MLLQSEEAEGEKKHFIGVKGSLSSLLGPIKTLKLEQ